MKTIGLIGGLSWESTTEYYKLINQAVQKARGGVSSAKIVMHSFNFEEIKQLQHDGNWAELTAQMINAARNLKNAGADFILICSNTMHKLVGEINAAVNIPILHIADPTGETIRNAGLKKIGLLGTAFTMEQPFYREYLKQAYGLDVVIPCDDGRGVVHNTIYDELVKGVVCDNSREKFKDVIAKLAEEGAEGVILGCTEIMMLIKDGDCKIPLYDTTEIHAMSAVQRALAA